VRDGCFGDRGKGRQTEGSPLSVTCQRRYRAVQSPGFPARNQTVRVCTYNRPRSPTELHGGTSPGPKYWALPTIDMNVACPRHPSTGAMPAPRPRRLSENNPATSAIASLRDDEVTECLWLPKLFFLALDTAPKPYYFGSKNPHVSAVFTTALLDLTSVRSTCATAANHRQLMSACRHDELGVANSNVTSEVTGQACPRHFACPGGPWSAPRGRQRKAGCDQCVPLIEQF